MTTTTDDKADQLLREGNVLETTLLARPRTFTVISGDTYYHVTLTQLGETYVGVCPCEFGLHVDGLFQHETDDSRCSHVKAAIKKAKGE